MIIKTIPAHKILPDLCQAMLKDAAKIKGMETRTQAIDNAVDIIRSTYPELYQPKPVYVNPLEK
jgi:hypothetical protein